MVEFDKDIKRILDRLDNPLVGCIRRGLKTQELPATAYELERNALLASFASHNVVSTPVGPVGVWLYDSTVVRINGGKLRWWWSRDLEEEWALVQTYSGYTLRPYAYSIQLIGNQMMFYCDTIDLDEEEWKQIAGDIVQSANTDPPGRIAKNRDRAYLACKRCPVKLECDTLDAVTPHGKDDWGRSYPFP